MKLLVLALAVCAFAVKLDVSPLIYGMLEGARLVDKVSVKRCSEQIFRETNQVSFSNFLKDSVVLSQKCSWPKAAKTLSKLRSSQEAYMKAVEDLHSFLNIVAMGPSKNHRNDGMAMGKILEYHIASMSPFVLKFKPGYSEFKELKASPYPVAVFHGLGDCCCFPGMIEFTHYLAKEANTYAKCVEVGDGPPASWLMAFQTQVNTACADIKKEAQFANGLNVVGLSQGGLIARALAEQCDIKVHNVITLGGPHMGVMSIPNCETGFYCEIFNDALDLGVYDPFVQNHFGPPGYYKDQYRYNEYITNSGFLAAANNERSVNANYATGFKAINQLVLVEFTEDTVVDPKESEWFWYYQNDSKDLLMYNQTTDYLNDVLGLQTLDQQGKIVFESIVGNHLEFNFTDVQQLVIPYLV